MADVLISYASEDRDRVRPLAQALEGRGFSIWWDRALASGQDYASVIERELANAKAVIVVWTNASVASTYVRDEAGRARDQGRLLPVMLDKVQPPLGFGSFQADDFTNWNGQRNAAQVQILEESIKAKLSGRDVDSAAVQRKRSRLGARIRMVSLLTVLALVIAIAAGGKYIFQPPHQDPRAQLLQLLQEGKLTPEQAIQLADLLKTDALGAEATGEANGRSASQAAPAPDSQLAADDEGVVTQASFEQDASQTYDAAFAQLLTHPDPGVRAAALQMTQPATRDAGIQAMWDYARAHPEDPAREQIYLVCGAVGERNNNPLAQEALERAAAIQPQNSRAWRMLSRSYQRNNRAEDARGAALVGAGVDAQAQGQTEVAEQHFEQALPQLTAPGPRAFTASSLGQIAERRQDWSAASSRYEEAYRAREQAATQNPNGAAAAGLQADAQHLVVALDRSGRTQEACQRLEQAQQAHDVNAPDEQLVNRCQVQFRSRLRPGLIQRVSPSPQTTATTRATP